ncbi:MAG: hypothetical protein OEM24_13665 [Paracoccaceae bacterium]|nr:hypothetical protein [Paracoccaceae bacterium]
MPAPRILLANEAGGGDGHVAKLALIARALGPGLPLVAALARPRRAAPLSALGARILRAPALSLAAGVQAEPDREGNATWGDYLAAIGLAREEVVRQGLAWWRSAIVAEDISLLVADYAPLALRAAQGLKAEGWAIETVAAGTGYGVPPAHLPRFPRLLPDRSRSVHPESELLALLNRVGAEAGLDPLPALPALGAADLALPMTFAFLDPYAGHRAAGELCAPVIDLAPGTAPEGDALFVYFSGTEADDPALIAALETLPFARLGYLPGASGATRARLAAAGMILKPAPLPPAAIAARARLVLAAGSHGTLCLAALAGLPQVALPQNLEQLCHGRRAEARGILRLVDKDARSAEAIAGTLRAAWSDAALARAALDSARALRADYPADPFAALATRLGPSLARAHDNAAQAG